MGCSYQGSQPTNVQYQERNAFSNAKVRVIQVDGHDYVLVTFKSGYAGGVSIVHSENCHCKRGY